jgi:RNA polymerase sigma-70 factor (ECF subfamily)
MSRQMPDQETGLLRPPFPREAPASASMDQERVRGLFSAHLDWVWRVLRRLGVSQDSVDDAAQQVFWTAARKIQSEPGPSDAKFLLAIAVRVASDHRRWRRRRREVGESPIEELTDGSPSAEDELDRRRALAAADELLDTLPWDLRIVFVLFEVEEKTTPEIAELLGIPLGTVASRLRRSRDAFAQAVARFRARQGSRGESP